MNKIILVDVDGVLLDWEDPFHRYITRHYPLLSEDVEIDWAEYSIAKRYNLDREFARVLIKMFNESAMMSTLPPLRDAVKYVKKLHTDHGYMFHVISSQSDQYAANQLRIQNLTNLYGNVFDGFTLLSTGDHKHKALKKWKDTDCFWIEDKLENALVGREVASLQSILVKHDYTDLALADEEWIPVFNNWYNIYNHITGDR